MALPKTIGTFITSVETRWRNVCGTKTQIPGTKMMLPKLFWDMTNKNRFLRKKLILQLTPDDKLSYVYGSRQNSRSQAFIERHGAQQWWEVGMWDVFTLTVVRL